MFLYDNNIISENSLTVTAEPNENFFEESMKYNKDLLTESMKASKYMMDVVIEYGDTEKIVTEAFADFKNKVLKFLREFKAKVVVLFRRWIDWIAKKLHTDGLYTDKAMDALLADNAKCTALDGFKMELSEPTDFGFVYFNELKACQYPKNLKASARTIVRQRVSGNNKDKEDYDVKKLRDELIKETNSFLNGNKMQSVTIQDIRAIYANKRNGKLDLPKYKNEVVDSIDVINKEAEYVGKMGVDMVKDQEAYNTIVTIASCLNEHLTTMANNYATYIDRINKLIAEFLPQAEQYLIANG